MASVKGRSEYKRALDEARGKSPDLNLVLDLLKRSIAKGNADATYALATWYLFGKGVRRDYRKAAELLKQCADSVAGASYDLAVCYEKGKGVDKNMMLAFEYYMRSAFLGDAQGYFEVGRCFFYGIGTERNRRVGDLWVKEAETRGYDDVRDARWRKAPSKRSRTANS